MDPYFLSFETAVLSGVHEAEYRSSMEKLLNQLAEEENQ